MKNTRPKRIVFIESWINPIYVRFANEFAKQHKDWQVYYITDYDSIYKNALDAVTAQVQLIGLKNNKWVRRLMYIPVLVGSSLQGKPRPYSDMLYLHSFKQLEKTLDSIQPSLIQSNVLAMPYTWRASGYAAKHNIPFILRTEERVMEGGVNRIGLNLLLIRFKKVVHDAKLILPWTEQSVSFAKKQLLVPKSRIALLPAGVDTTLFSSLARKPRSSKAPLRLLVVQRFVPYKDYPTLLRGVAKAREQGLRFTLSIVGFGPEEHAIHALTHELELDSCTKFLSSVAYEEMPALYRKHDILIHTGRNEAIGMVVPESMACGVVPVVCDSAGAITYVTSMTGFIFKTGDPESLAQSLQHVQQQDISAMSKRAAAHIAANYSVPATVRAYEKLLRKHVPSVFA